MKIGPPKVDAPNPFLALQSRYLVLGTYLIASVAVGLAYAYLGQYQLLPWAFDDPLSMPILSIAIWLVVVGVILGVGQGHGLQLKYVFGRRLPPDFSWPYIALLVLSLLMFSMGSFSVVFYVVSLLAPEQAAQMLETDLVLSGEGSGFPQFYSGLMIFLLVVFAPVVEELVFRGILLQRWATKWGLRVGIVGSSVVFGMLHFSNPVGLTLFGLVMALLYVRTQSLWVPMVCHALNNLTVVILDRSSSFGMGDQADAVTVAAVQERWWAGLILIVIAFPILSLFLRRSWPQAKATIPYLLNRSRADKN
ncbi:MAG: CPBP family intramembrane glutamic endopeptidase [Cyanobacteria bacterium J06573_11]